MDPQVPQSTPQQTPPPAPQPQPAQSTPASLSQPASQPAPAQKTANSVVKPLRTYERDIAEMIRNQQVSVVSVNLAQQKKREEQAQQVQVTPQSVPMPPVKKERVIADAAEKVASGTMFILLSLVLIAFGGGALGLMYLLNKETPPSAQQQLTETLLPSNQARAFDLTGFGPTQAREQFPSFVQETFPDDSITHIEVFSRNSGAKVDVEAEAFFEQISTTIPASLSRAFDKKFFAGIYTLQRDYPFFIIRIDSFDNAFEGMLAWEKTLYEDIDGLISPSDADQTALIAIPNAQFEDAIIQNKDTRVLKNNQGDIILLYSFVDSQTLFITSNDQTFREILNRFIGSKLIR